MSFPELSTVGEPLRWVAREARNDSKDHAMQVKKIFMTKNPIYDIVCQISRDRDLS